MIVGVILLDQEECHGTVLAFMPVENVSVRVTPDPMPAVQVFVLAHKNQFTNDFPLKKLESRD